MGGVKIDRKIILLAEILFFRRDMPCTYYSTQHKDHFQ